MIGYILAAGTGRRVAPYGECRPKCLIPVVNRPVIGYLIDAMREAGVNRIIVGANRWIGDIRAAVREHEAVEVTDVGETNGTAQTLSRCVAAAEDDDALVLYGDVLVDAADVSRLASASAEHPTLLVTPLPDAESRDWIVARLDGDRLSALVGHPRGGPANRVAGFLLPRGFRNRLDDCPAHFPTVEVGMMPPAEYHLESAVEAYRRDGNHVAAVVSREPTVDVDKPWHILSANELALTRACAQLSSNRLADGASIDESAQLDGPVSLGRGSRIGTNVIARGSIIAGDNVVIDSGAIIDGNVAIGDGSFVGNACFVGGGSVIGRECVVSHAAELSGVIFDGVYLYHYMEIYGVVGVRTDIGAATVCGSLRFDDGETAHRVLGRREVPRRHSNATFIGDYCRTGVNAVIMPGKRIGPYSIVGPAVLLEEDLPANTGVRVKQAQEHYSWGPNRYGW